MLQRLSVLKSAIQLYAGYNEIPISTANKWQLIEKERRLLQPFFRITKKVNSEQSILSAVIPEVAVLANIPQKILVFILLKSSYDENCSGIFL